MVLSFPLFELFESDPFLAAPVLTDEGAAAVAASVAAPEPLRGDPEPAERPTDISANERCIMVYWTGGAFEGVEAGVDAIMEVEDDDCDEEEEVVVMDEDEEDRTAVPTRADGGLPNVDVDEVGGDDEGSASAEGSWLGLAEVGGTLVPASASSPAFPAAEVATAEEGSGWPARPAESFFFAIITDSFVVGLDASVWLPGWRRGGQSERPLLLLLLLLQSSPSSS
ncbi:hypothetical protein DFJ73DRAFT_831986 [Zopfochytrium polystomum]|nr:hypothetical protein DFJ73DRAFT_831986 [Zopfochytrium polystomum]